VDLDETCFRGLGIKTMLEGADEAKVVILETLLRVGETVVVESIRTSVLHPRLEAGNFSHLGHWEGYIPRKNLSSKTVSLATKMPLMAWFE